METNLSAEETTPPQLILPTTLAANVDMKDVLHKELDLIQAIVTRMASNSFQCKGWLIGILTFVLALGKDSVFSLGWYAFILLLPVFVFWWLDAFFLYMEKRYRDLYNYTVDKRTGKEIENPPTYYNLKYTAFEPEELWGAGFRKHFKVWLSKRSQIHRVSFWKHLRAWWNGLLKPETIIDVMLSKSLRTFYFLPIFFILLVALKGADVIKLPESKEKKEPTIIQLDATTLKPVLEAIEKAKAIPNVAPIAPSKKENVDSPKIQKAIPKQVTPQ
jgi:hypothetical protein